MSRFDTLMNEQTPVLMEQLGSSVVYEEIDADAVTLTALVGSERNSERIDTDGQRVLIITREITISTDPTSADGGVAAPKKTATFVIGNYEWSIDSITALSGSTARLSLTRAAVREITRPGYRNNQ